MSIFIVLIQFLFLFGGALTKNSYCFMIIFGLTVPLFIKFEKKDWILFIIPLLSVTYFELIDWKDKLLNFNKLYSFGTVRHVIRYSTLLFGGIIGCVYLLTNGCNRFWRWFCVLVL